MDGGDVIGHGVMQVNSEAHDGIFHENGRVNDDGELDFVSDGCLDNVEYDNRVVDEDSEFEEVEYYDEDAEEDNEFYGCEYDDEDGDDDGELDGDDYDDEIGSGYVSGHEYWNTDSNGGGISGEGSEWGSDRLNESISSDQLPDESFVVDEFDDIANMDMFNLQCDDVSKLQFGSLEIAYTWYCWFAKMNGFAVRKGQVIKKKSGDVTQQTFLCNLAGFRQNKVDNRKRGLRHETRCGCEAKFRVHIDIISHRWYVTVFTFEHNHAMLKEKHCRLLAGNRKLSKSDKMQIKNFGNAGIKVTQMIGSFANATGGYDKVGFLKKDVHNQIARQRKEMSSDAKGAVRYLIDLRVIDPLMLVAHTVGADGTLQNLFWSDGESQKNYELFGDVLAFDATYKKNKYRCPFVVFSGVNHHNQTIIFATAIVSNEVEGTYVWLLEQFLVAMKGKTPLSVITDGDVAMRNAIRKVFPNSYHRLCAWHLLRNAISNISNPNFIPVFKKLMLGDHDVWKFESLWNEMLDRFGLEDNNWINELYQKRKMWATAHIRGNFFAGIRTTSRCEAFHSHMGQFVHSRMNMTDFVKQFHRCVAYFRFREVQADFESQYGQAVLHTNLRALERSTSKHWTKEIFEMVRSVMKKVTLTSVLDIQDMASVTIYAVTKYRDEGHGWRVSHCSSNNDFRCSCLRMESIGIPCEHIVAVMVYLNIVEFPENLVLNRWSLYAKESISGSYEDGSHYWDSHLVARHATLVNLSKEVADLSYMDVDDYKKYLEYLTNELCRLKSKYNNEDVPDNIHVEEELVNILNPSCSRSKGCGPGTVGTLERPRRTQTCGICGAAGHNRRCCPTLGADGEPPADSSLQSASVRLSNDYGFSV
ncbi:protein FAR1-RELATED SEQUENCE 5-like [Vicia villosa]|uniref:protein FAR1-RELATED SEQUENCE 5-like n=1 Tax=Vicia villosa TaxID=3911 RepID=UPI00273C82B3|nr:protein FAR1-RELATED SEQUENCE 5-like [Vicia villosa]